MSYVTGSHNMKFGAQYSQGIRKLATEPLNAALIQVYQNGVPVSVTLSNTPVRYSQSVNADLGFYAQDTWAWKRLSINYGLRWEYFEAQIDEETSGAGRWIGARTFPGEVLPTWGGAGGFTPRSGVVYDIFGTGKTALKFGVNKYNRQLVDDLTNRYNPIRPQTASVTWRDLDADDVADGFPGCTYLNPGCEINLAQVPASFGLVTPGCSVIATAGSIPCGTGQVDPDIQRGYSIQYNMGVQHELFPRISVNAYWFYSKFYDLARTDNILQSFSDYTPVQIVSPLDGSVITMYNVSTAARTRLQNLEHTSANDSRSNKAFETGFSARLPRRHHGLRRHGDRTDARQVMRRDRRSQPPAVLRRLCRRRHAVVDAVQALGRDPLAVQHPDGDRVPDLQAFSQHDNRYAMADHADDPLRRGLPWSVHPWRARQSRNDRRDDERSARQAGNGALG